MAFAIPKSNRDPAQLTSVEVAQPMIYEQYETSQTSQQTSTICGERSLQDKPAGMELDYDVERAAGSRT